MNTHNRAYTRNNRRLQTKIRDTLAYAILISIGLGVGFGAKEAYAWYSTPAVYIETDTTAHFADTAQKVVMYTTQWCPYCKKAKQYLKDNQIAFEERDIEQGGEQVSALFQSIDAPGIPKIVVGDKVIIGFNQPVLQQELKQQQLLM